MERPAAVTASRHIASDALRRVKQDLERNKKEKSITGTLSVADLNAESWILKLPSALLVWPGVSESRCDSERMTRHTVRKALACFHGTWLLSSAPQE